jgi:hypothetical protein
MHVYTTAEAVLLLPSTAPADPSRSCLLIGRDAIPPKVELLHYADALRFAAERRSLSRVVRRPSLRTS